MGFFKSIGRAIGRGVETVGGWIGNETVSNFGRNIQDACSETSSRVSETREYDKQSATIHETAKINEILSDFSIKLQRRADEIESECLNATQEYFEAVITSIEETDISYGVKRARKTMEQARKKIKGSVKNHLAKRVSIDDAECLRVLKLAAGNSKKSKMEQFGKKVINEALLNLSRQLDDLVEDHSEELEMYFKELIEQQNKDVLTMKASLDAQLENWDKGVSYRLKAKKEPELVMEVSEEILSLLS